MKTRSCFLGFAASIVALAAGRAYSQTESVTGDVISLAGQWQVAMDPKQEGVKQGLFNKELPERINLPGSTDQAHLGTRNASKPTLDGLYRLYTYEGPAWYSREVEIPAAWKGKLVSLFLERAHGETRVWLDGRQHGTENSLIAPQVFDLGADLSPGKHRLTICMDNTRRFDLGPFLPSSMKARRPTGTGWWERSSCGRRTPYPSKTCRSTRTWTASWSRSA